MRLKLASRRSDLARWQAIQIGRALEQARPGLEIEYHFKASLGDQNLDLPLAGMGAKGVFTEDFYRDLIAGRTDLVVHSWKDLPVEERADTRIAMTLPRADVRDLLLIPEETWRKARAARRLTVFTSSPRRVHNLAPVLPKLLPGGLTLEFKPVRGNVPTRLRKMKGEGAALILAKAGLDRLLEAERDGLPDGEPVRALIENCRFQVLPVSLNPPAPAQGALAVEIAASHETMRELGARLNDRATMAAVERERRVLKGYGGGCHQKIGVAVLPREYGTVYALRGLTDAGETLRAWRVESDTPWTRAASDARIFPLAMKDVTWFRREALPRPEGLEKEAALLVARAEAWPQGYAPPAGQVIWTAGVQTWMALAGRGVFVNGTHDGLGEKEAATLDALLGRPVAPCKLSHAESRGARAVYRLEPRADAPDLRGKTHFFWTSATGFARARALFPDEIKNGFHACGPGHTLDFLRTVEGLRHPVKVFAGLPQFLEETRPEPGEEA